MKLHILPMLVLLLATPWLASNVRADSILGTSANFAVLAGSTVTNVNATQITGDLGVSPGTAVTGFPPGIVNGTILTGTNAVVETAQTDLTNAFTTEAGLPSTGAILGGNLTGLTLGPGVYTVSAASSNLAGTLILSDGGVAGSIFVFQMASTLITSPGSKIDVSGLSPTDSLFWVVNSSATLGDNTSFEGNILASASISFDPGATDLCGRALAETGGVTFAGQNPTTLVQNAVSIGCVGTSGAGGGAFDSVGASGTVPTPEPATFGLMLGGLVCLFCFSSWRKRGQPVKSMDLC